MKAAYSLLACLALATAALAQAPQVPDAAPLKEAPSGTNSRIVIRAGAIGNKTISIDINGQRVATMPPSQTYEGVYSPGRLRINMSEGNRVTSMNTYALANEEYVFELGLETPPAAGIFGIAGAIAASKPVLVMTGRKETIAGFIPPSTTAKPASNPAAESSAPARTASPITPASASAAPPAKSIEAAQQLVVSQPSNPHGWRDLGKQYQSAGESDKAIRAYQQALRLDPRDLDSLEGIGAMYAKEGQRAKVRETWETLAKIDKARAERFLPRTSYPRPAGDARLATSR
jgi:tetratricopeptide (TPR) repeat protein